MTNLSPGLFSPCGRNIIDALVSTSTSYPLS